MDFEEDVSFKGRYETKYDFSGAKNGSSLWVPTNGARVSTMDAFKRWASKNKTTLTVTSKKVGVNDPKGEGFRVFFVAEKPDLRPVVLGRLPSYSNITDMQRFILEFTGLMNDEDIIAAAMSCDPVPTTVTEANAVCRLIWSGNTPKQIDNCIEKHGMTLHQFREKKEREALERDAEHEERMSKYRITDEMRRGDDDDAE